MNRRVMGAIFARGGSKGVPRKNLRLLGGKPLIAHSIETALACTMLDRVIVSTDDPEIADVARQYGAEVPFMRPSELVGDDSPEWLSWQHAIRFLQSESPFDVFVCLPPTSPLRSVEDVHACIETLLSSDADLVYTIKHTDHSPYFNMVVLDDKGYARLVIPPERALHRRQDAPVVYDSTTVAYVARPDFVLNSKSMFEGKVKTVIVPEKRAVEIDTEMDFKYAEFMLDQITKQGE